MEASLLSYCNLQLQSLWTVILTVTTTPRELLIGRSLYSGAVVTVTASCYGYSLLQLQSECLRWMPPFSVAVVTATVSPMDTHYYSYRVSV